MFFEKENVMQVLRTVRRNHMRALLVALLIVLVVWVTHAEAQYIDLSNGVVVTTGRCTYDKQVYPCVMVQQDDQIYLVALDPKKQREVAIWTVKGAKGEYKKEEVTLIWAIDGI